MQVRARLDSDFNILQKRKLSPEFAIDQKNKEERESRIKRFYRIFNEQVKQGKDKINKNNFKNYQERYVNYVREARKDPNTRWIYESYNYDINRNTKEIKPYYISPNLKRHKTQRQKIYIKALKARELKIIKEKYDSKNNSNLGLFRKINELFELIELEKKIKFEYNFELFVEKCKIIKNFIEEKGIEQFIGDEILENIIIGEKDFDNIFDPEIFNFLITHGIINDLLIFEYKMQFTHRFRDLAQLRLKELALFYKQKFNFIYELLFNSDFLINPDENKLNIYIINNNIKPCIEKYLFFINYTLNKFFTIKNNLFEIAFEDFYYYELKHNLYFIKFFLDCKNDNSLNGLTLLGEGGFGKVYRVDENTILKITNNPVLERNFFEFFKQLCLTKVFREKEVLIPDIYEFKLGEDQIYLKIENAGITLLEYITLKFNKLNKSNHNFETDKVKIIINILKSIGKTIKKCQENKFLHNDFNPRNIMIKNFGNLNNSNLKFYLIDFDFSIIFIKDLYIFNFNKQIDLENTFSQILNGKKKIITYYPFAKSVDLFRFMMYIFILPNYMKKYVKNKSVNNCPNNLTKFNQTDESKYSLSPIFLNNIRILLYGTNNELIPMNTAIHYENPNNKRIKKYFDTRLISFANILLLRSYIFNKFANTEFKQEWIRDRWILKNHLWIQSFMPEFFIERINLM
jgi:hypothetical protein